MLTELDSGAPDDFDFEIGDWRVKHRKLKEIFNDCHDWLEFEGESSTTKILGGFGNVENNLLHHPDASFRAIAIRSYDKKARKWAIWWLDGRAPHHLDTPVVGEFTNGIGLFFADEIINDLPTKVRFTWNATNPDQLSWEQAFSRDEGATWEINWTMEFTPKR